MEKETYDKLKNEFPVIFTAAFVSLVSSTLYYKNPANLLSKEVADIIIYSLFWVLAGCGIIYGFFKIIVKK